MERRLFLTTGLGACIASAFASAFVSAPVRADEALDAALSDIAKARASIVSLQGTFAQERSIALLKSKVKSTGKMILLRPDRLRWELDPPDAAIYWVLPDALAYKTKAGTGRVAKGAQGPLGGVLGDLLVLIGGDLGALRSRYDLRLLQRDPEKLVVDAIPKDRQLAKNTRKIELEFGSDLAVLKRVVMFESGSDRSEIVFGKMTRGGAIDPKLLIGP